MSLEQGFQLRPGSSMDMESTVKCLMQNSLGKKSALWDLKSVSELRCPVIEDIATLFGKVNPLFVTCDNRKDRYNANTRTRQHSRKLSSSLFRL